MLNNIKIILFLFSCYLYSQNIEMYLSLINEGQLSGVKEQLPELISKYPNNPDIMFLEGIMTTDGNKSIEIYKKILTKFPESRYASESAVKIGEYYYSLGLYSQAGKHLSQVPRVYPRYSNIQRIMDLMVSSFLAIGEEDSAKYYSNIYKSMFPTLDVNNFGEGKKNLSKYGNNSQKKSINKAYIIQVGAFSNIDNAKRMKLQISQIGYDVEIAKVETKGLKLYAVRVVRYETKFEAEKVGKLLKKKLGNEYRVLYRPQN